MREPLSLRERWRDYHPSKAMWLWSCFTCILATVMVGFAWGGWVTASGAQRLVADARQDTRDRLAAGICVARFEAAPDAAQKLAALKATVRWKQSDFIAKGGWLTIPGISGPLSDAGSMCLERLLALPTPPARASTSQRSASAD